tara:strand:- start:8918 stop:10825 length:1908 start_codon:yes stop_codon:yes gene_type:complete
MKNIFLFSIIFISSSYFAQITIQNTLTPTQIVQNVLLGSGVTASNIQWNGSLVNSNTVQANLGAFGGAPGIGMNNGVILATGNVSEAVGPNISSSSGNNTGVANYDTDLDLIGLQPPGIDIYDGGVLEFDFIPTGDSISFNYVFASEEYPEYAPPNNSGFNDAFGFFLTGTNPSGGNYTSQNIAVLPGTGTIVSINNINPVTNSTYYVDNAGGLNLEYDGHTTLLQARAGVVCGETYHIKLAISDAGDGGFNSAVFLEANSFSSNTVDVSIVAQTGDTTVIEGCADAEVFFIRAENDTATALTVNYVVTGTAINGVDYNTLPGSVTFLPGQDSVSLSIIPILDLIVEGPESIIITAYTINTCGDTLFSTGTLWIIDQSTAVTVNDISVPCPSNSVINLVATPTSGFGPFTYLWDDGSTNDTLFVTLLASGTYNYSVTITDQCGKQGSDNATITVGTFDAASFTASPTSGQSPLTVNFTNTSTTAGIASYYWDFGNGLNQTTTSAVNVSTVYPDDGIFTVLLLVTSDANCVDTVTKTIQVYSNPLVVMPNVFSPNGDKVNEFYEIAEYSNVEKFECRIFNRWGEQMYVISSVLDKWNGKNKQGNAATDGVYFYTFSAESKTGQTLEGQGFFHLVNE